MTNWQEFRERAQRAEREATVYSRAADQARCSTTDSGGARCTADFFPATHEHEYRQEAEDGQ